MTKLIFTLALVGFFFSVIAGGITGKAAEDRQVMNKSEALGALENYKDFTCYQSLNKDELANKLATRAPAITNWKGEETFDYSLIKEVANEITIKCLYSDIIKQLNEESDEASTNRLKTGHSLFIGLQDRGVYEKNTDFFSASVGAMRGQEWFSLLSNLSPSGMAITPDPFGKLRVSDLETKSLNQAKLEKIFEQAGKTLDSTSWSNFKFLRFNLPRLTSFMMDDLFVWATAFLFLAYKIFNMLINEESNTNDIIDTIMETTKRALIWWLSPVVVFLTIVITTILGMAMLTVSSGDSQRCTGDTLTCIVASANMNSALNYWPSTQSEYIQNDADFWVSTRKAIRNTLANTGVQTLIDIQRGLNPFSKVGEGTMEGAEEFLQKKEQNPFLEWTFTLASVLSIVFLGSLALSQAKNTFILILVFSLVRIGVFLPFSNLKWAMNQPMVYVKNTMLNFLLAALMIKITSIVSLQLGVETLILLVILYTIGTGIIGVTLNNFFGYNILATKKQKGLVDAINDIKASAKSNINQLKQEQEKMIKVLPSGLVKTVQMNTVDKIKSTLSKKIAGKIKKTGLKLPKFKK
jgi:hypothetical protein